MTIPIVQIERKPWRDIYDFLFAAQLGREYRVAQFIAKEDGTVRLEWKEYKEGDEITPTFSLNGMEVRELKRALDQYGPTTEDALTLAQDVVRVRDRLLTLVEDMVNADK